MTPINFYQRTHSSKSPTKTSQVAYPLFARESLGTEGELSQHDITFVNRQYDIHQSISLTYSIRPVTFHSILLIVILKPFPYTITVGDLCQAAHRHYHQPFLHTQPPLATFVKQPFVTFTIIITIIKPFSYTTNTGDLCQAAPRHHQHTHTYRHIDHIQSLHQTTHCTPSCTSPVRHYCLYHDNTHKHH